MNKQCEIVSPVIVALDYASSKAADCLVDQLDASECRVKVGKQLFTAAGPEYVRSLVERDFQVFLDLKFHDIPNTVAEACRAAAELGVWMLNVHASGGRRMMEAAANAIEKSPTNPLLIAVSVLTSMTESDLHETGVAASVSDQVALLSRLAANCGLHGMVCSAHEVELIRRIAGDTFKLVTPGIRTLGSEQGDQRRIMTPTEAMRIGADYLVVGRSITGADDPMSVLNTINKQLKGH